MEDDPEFHRMVKAFLTNEVKDEEEKRRVVITFEAFCLLYKKDSLRYESTETPRAMTGKGMD